MPAHSPAEIHVLFEQAFNLGDVESLMALYEPDAILVIGGTEVTGRERIRAAFENLVADRRQMTLTTRAVLGSALGIALVHGDWVIEPAKGLESATRTKGFSTEVVRQQPDGTWRFVIDNPYTPETSRS